MGIQEVTLKTVDKWFYGIMAVLILFFVSGLLINPLGTQLNVFFAKTNNLLADFFNVQIYIADWDPYHNTVNGLGEKCYLPFTYLFLELFNGFFNYSGATLADCYSSTTAMMSCILFMIVSLFFFYHSMTCLTEMPSKLKFVLLLSSVILFSFERGNIIVFCAALICYFLAYKDSKNKWLKYISLICLCIVSIVKIYPAIFGLYLLKDKRYKDIAICVLVSLIFAFLPFLFFKGGFGNISQMFENFSVFSQSYSAYSIFPRYGLSHIIAWGLMGLHIDKHTSNIILLIPQFLIFMLCLLSFVLFFFEKQAWKRLALVALPIIMLPTNSGFYCGLYFIPVIVLFFYNNEGRKLDFLYMLLICLFLSPFQLPVVKGINLSQQLSNVALLTIWILLLIDVRTCLGNLKKDYKLKIIK